MSPTRILVVIADPHGGGARYVVSLSKVRTLGEYHITVAYAAGGPELIKATRQSDYLDYIPVSLPRAAADYSDLEGLTAIFNRNFHVIHYVGTRAALYGTFAMKLSEPDECPYQIYSAISLGLDRYPPGRKRSLRLAINREIARQVDCVVVNSDRKEGVRMGVFDDSRTTTLWNGVEVPTFSETAIKAAAVRRNLNIRGIMVLFVGRMEVQKDPITLLRAISIVQQTRPGLELVMVGDGSLESEVRTFVSRSANRGRVALLGWRADFADLIAASDLLVVPSRWEGLPYVLLDAMAAKKPVVATRVNGIKDAVIDGFNGLLVDPGNHEAMARAILDLAGSSRLRSRLGKAARSTVVENFQEGDMLCRLDELYRGGREQVESHRVES